MAIFAVTTASILSAIVFSMDSLKLSRQTKQATQILIDKTETLRLYNWEQINTPGFLPTAFVVRRGGVEYHGSCKVDRVQTGTSYNDDLRQIKFRLDWKTGSLARNREWTTFVARYGLQEYLY